MSGEGAATSGEGEVHRSEWRRGRHGAAPAQGEAGQRAGLGRASTGHTLRVAAAATTRSETTIDG
eukprot:2555375-Prymnesium_polylepis.1